MDAPSTREVIEIRPIYWSVIPLNDNSKIIQCFGQNEFNERIAVYFPSVDIYVLKYAELVDDETQEEISQSLSPVWSRFSPYNENQIILGNPQELSLSDPSIKTWTESKHNPGGDLSSFWNYHEISPYRTFRLTIFQQTASMKRTTSDREYHLPKYGWEITSSSREIYIKTRDILYDIEVQSGDQFPSAKNPNDRIFMISLILSYQNDELDYVTKGSGRHPLGYLLHLGKINDRELGELSMPFELIELSTEVELINQFFSIWQRFQPDFLISYNGDHFDMPYILDRCKLLNIMPPNLSKIVNYPMKIGTSSIAGPFGWEKVTSIKTPGVESIDLINYFRRYYPNLPNHKLNTVAETFLNERKVDLDISIMQEYVRSNDPDKLAIVARYSIYDSILLSNLVNRLGIVSEIFQLSNLTNTSIYEQLTSTTDKVIDSFISRLDPGLVGEKLSNDFLSFLSPPKLGYYKNVSRYEYSDLLFQALYNPDDMSLVETSDISQIIFEIFDGYRDMIPQRIIGSLIYKIFASGYLPTSVKMKAKLYIDDLKNVVSVRETELLKLESSAVEVGLIPLDRKIDRFTVITPTSYISLVESKEIKKGLSEICRPKFMLMSMLINQLIETAYSLPKDEYVSVSKSVFNIYLNDVTQTSNVKLLINEKIKGKDNYQTGTTRYLLSKQYEDITGKKIDTWVEIQYLKVIVRKINIESKKEQKDEKLDLLLTKYRQSPDLYLIDYAYYQKKLNNVYQTLSKLPIY